MMGHLELCEQYSLNRVFFSCVERCPFQALHTHTHSLHLLCTTESDSALIKRAVLGSALCSVCSTWCYLST